MSKPYGAVSDMIGDWLRRAGLSNSPDGLAADLAGADLLHHATTRCDPVEAAANILQCRMSWPDAEALAKALDEAGLLATRATQ